MLGCEKWKCEQTSPASACTRVDDCAPADPQAFSPFSLDFCLQRSCLHRFFSYNLLSSLLTEYLSSQLLFTGTCTASISGDQHVFSGTITSESTSKIELTWTEAGPCLPPIQCVTILQSAFSVCDKFIHFTSGVQDSASAINTSSFNGILSTILAWSLLRENLRLRQLLMVLEQLGTSCPLAGM